MTQEPQDPKDRMAHLATLGWSFGAPLLSLTLGYPQWCGTKGQHVMITGSDGTMEEAKLNCLAAIEIYEAGLEKMVEEAR